MTCLTSEQVQAVADNEASRAEREHAASCVACGHRVAERRTQTARVTAAATHVDMPAATARRIDAALARGGGAAGATRLRPSDQPQWRRAAWGTTAVAAATILAVVFVAPALKQDGGGVSAADVLAASAHRLAQPATGVEVLEYQLILDGVPRELMPDHANGIYRVSQTIDHRTPGRFRFASYGPDGQLVSSVAQDPAAGRRTVAFNLDRQAYRFELNIPSQVGPSLPEMQRLHTEATIAMMQASRDQSLEIVDTADGRQYRIDVPKVQAPLANPVWDLSEARLLIHADDYRVSELDVKGSFLKQPYSVSYRLISRLLTDDVAADTFVIPSQAGEIVIEGEGTLIPARDTVLLALRELARLKQAR